jgi:5-methylcytosine-specific restriction endonuclease McrA
LIPKSAIDRKIKDKKVMVLRTSERATNGIYTKEILYNDRKYKLCVDCKHYLSLESFTLPHAKCKKCRNKRSREKRKVDFRDSMYYRWKSQVNGFEVFCSFEEFLEWVETAKCIFTGRTLKEDFENPHQNKLLRLEVDHIIARSKGGHSLTSNMQIVPSFWNRLKSTGTNEECTEVVEYLRENII